MTSRRFGPFGHWRFALALAGFGVVTAVQAQEKPDFNKFEQYRIGSATIDEAGKAVLEKVARYYAARLIETAEKKEGISDLIQREFARRLLLPPAHPYARLNAEQKKFVDEFGRAMIGQIDQLLQAQSKPIIRINAMRMASEVARGGYDGAAELFLKTLDKADESDAVKLYALTGIDGLFAIEPEKDVQPARTIFQKNNTLQQTPLERRCIIALIQFVLRKSPVPENAPQDELDAVRMIRCEALRALGKVRVQSVKNLGEVQGRPALVLLKASRSDGLAPATNVRERVEAIVGFCQLIPDKDRDMQLDYAVYHLGQALSELAEYKNANLQDMSIPWRVSAARMQDVFERWRSGVDDLKLANAKLVKEFVDAANLHVLEPLLAGKEGVAPNVEGLRNWLGSQVKLDDKASLFKSDPTTRLNVK